MAIALPLTSDRVHTQFLDSWVLLQKPEEFVYCRPDFPIPSATVGNQLIGFGGPMSEIRNQLVEQALRNSCTHMVMMDTDQVYPPETITKLLGHWQYVVGTRVYRRYPPFDPVMYRGELHKAHRIPDEECLSGKLVEVDFVGTGCVMFDMRIFMDLEPPWFRSLPRTEEHKPVGEDFYISHRIRQAGYKIYVDTSIDITHLATMEVNSSTYALYRFLHGKRRREAEGHDNIDNQEVQEDGSESRQEL